MKYNFCPKCGSRLEFGKLKDNDKKRLYCPDCGFIFYQNPKPAVGVIIFREPDEILLVKRNIHPYKNFWSFAGGFIEENEKPEDALKREVLEELNLKVKKTDFFGFYVDNRSYQKDSLLGIIYFSSSDRIDFSNIKIDDDEIKDFKFFKLKNLPQKVAFPLIVKKSLEDFKERFAKR